MLNRTRFWVYDQWHNKNTFNLRQMNIKDVRLTVLDNGLTVVTHSVVRNDNAVDIAVGLMVGSRDEINGNHPRGAMHALEHAFSYGSVGQQQRLRANIEGIPGFDHATHKFDLCVGFSTMTCQAIVPWPYAHLTIGTIGEALSKPDIASAYVERERHPILSESIINEQSVGSLDTIYASYVGHGQHPSLYPVIGGAKGLRQITPDALTLAFQQHVRAGRTIIVVEGDLPHEEIVGVVARSFSMPPGARADTVKPAYTGGDKRWPLAPLGFDPVAGVHVAVGFKAPVLGNFRAAAASALVRSMLTAPPEKGAYSVFGALRGTNNFVYRTSVAASQGIDSGLVTIAYETIPELVRPSLIAVRDLLAGMADNIDMASFGQARAFRQKERERILNLATVGAPSLFDDVLMHGKPIEPTYYEDLKLDIKPEEVSAAARDMLEHPPTFLAAGNLEGLPFPDEIRDIFDRRATSKSYQAEVTPAFA
jgi:predicted Zn-dependent peptidase